MNTTLKTHLAMLALAAGVFLHAPAHAKYGGGHGVRMSEFPACSVANPNGFWEYTDRAKCKELGGVWLDNGKGTVPVSSPTDVNNPALPRVNVR